jgi:hypothetical protein
VLSFGAGAEVLAPETLRADVAAELTKARAPYAARGARPQGA